MPISGHLGGLLVFRDGNKTPCGRRTSAGKHGCSVKPATAAHAAQATWKDGGRNALRRENMEKSYLEQVGGFPTKIQNIVVKNGNVPPTKTQK